GLQDVVQTPAGRMPGIEVHAEALDNAIDGRLLRRPPWAPALEAALLALLAAVALAIVPLLRPLPSVAIVGGLALATLAAGVLAFGRGALLLDSASPIAGASLVFGFMLAVSLGQAQLQRRRLQQALMSSREAQARLEGELDAARRIQMGMLPVPEEVLGDETRVEVAARMQPARTVGGDLYDFYRLDQRRLLFLIGDVSGKGLPASLFMALCKALAKGVAPHAGGDPARVLTATAAAIVGDNPEQLFVTALAGVLDLDSGHLSWCCAGHDAPYLLRAGSREAQRLSGAGGPPLCVIDGFEYPLEELQLQRGDLLCLITDGVTEAHNAGGELYGAQRLLDALAEGAAEPSLEKLADALLQDVGSFVGAAEPSDDAALLLLRWRG
ncbi:MAG TPA: SpoIIE family protein phosphatase, partial [Solimonas sp.]|nr:SpoIIE family protein phosphatase [Solimonas sp.]